MGIEVDLVEANMRDSTSRRGRTVWGGGEGTVSVGSGQRGFLRD